MYKKDVYKFFIRRKWGGTDLDFALEGWWTTDFAAYPLNAISKYSIRAVEAAEVLVIDVVKQERLLQEFPILERYFHLVYQKGVRCFTISDQITL